MNNYHTNGDYTKYMHKKMAFFEEIMEFSNCDILRDIRQYRTTTVSKFIV